MKEETKQILESMLLNKHKYDNCVLVDKLFNVYLMNEVDSVEHIVYLMHGDFVDFIKEHKDAFVINNVLEWSNLKKYAENKIWLLDRWKVSTYRYNLNRNERFACSVVQLVKEGGLGNASLLEVGSGFVPYSSMLIAQGMKDVSSMDNFHLPVDVLAKMNVKAINGFMGPKTDISDFGVIVGQAPCDAIDYIVEKSALAKKPYFVELCECRSPDDTLEGYVDYLKKTKDKNLRFIEEVADFDGADYFRNKYSEKYKHVSPSINKNIYVYSPEWGISDEEVQDIIEENNYIK